MPSPLDPFIPAPDARERFAVTVRAPAALVYDVACAFDMQSIFAVRTIFRMRERIMGSRPGVRVPRGLVAELEELGWGCLLERPGELFVGGAVCQPWLADVKFRAVPPEKFAAFADPDLVKIAWTLETRSRPQPHRAQFGDSRDRHGRCRPTPLPGILALGPGRDLLDPLASASRRPTQG